MKKLTRISASILEKIAEATLDTADLIVGMQLAGYGASGKMMRRKAEEFRDRREQFVADLKARQRFYNLLSKLKKEGLIMKNEKGWSLTKSGHNFRKKEFPIGKDYSKEDDNTFKIITFDIPERDRRKRIWLNDVLGKLYFNRLQKSVWIGKTRIPEKFLEDLNALKILHCVHILEITKKGTVAELS